MNGEPTPRGPRPLDFVRVRLYRGGQIELVKSILEDEKEALFEDLGKLRDRGADENSAEVEEVRANLGHLIRALRDIESGLVELVGTGEHR